VTSGLILLAVLGLAFIATHVVADWVARRFVVVSGAEYLILGVLLGPVGFGVMGEAELEAFSPVTLLALGFIGLGVGMRMHLATLVQVPGLVWRLSFAQSLLALTTIAGTVAAVLAWRGDLSLTAAIAPAVALGAIGACSLPQAVDVGAQALGRDGPTVQLLRTASLVDSLVGIVVVGVVLALDHGPLTGVARMPTPTEWVVIATGIGTASGILFHLFLGSDTSGDRLVVALGAATLLATGAAAHLDLSPLFSTMVMGAILVNTSRNREALVSILERAERPLIYVLLVLAGAAWRPGADVAWLVPLATFLLFRAVGKVGGARLAARANGALAIHGPDWGRALMGQGGLALALAFSWLRRDGSALPQLVFTAAVAAMVLTDLSAARLVRSVLEPLLPPPGTSPRELEVAAARAAAGAAPPADSAPVAGD
jgi:hypothetical protein